MAEAVKNATDELTEAIDETQDILTDAADRIWTDIEKDNGEGESSDASVKQAVTSAVNAAQKAVNAQAKQALAALEEEGHGEFY